MNTYLFHITLSGMGNTMEDAWEDAVEQFGVDPGAPDPALCKIEILPADE